MTNQSLVYAGVGLPLIAAYCLAKTWFQPAGIFATVGAVLIVVVVLVVGVSAAISVAVMSPPPSSK